MSGAVSPSRGVWRRLAPFLDAGPISGPLLAGAVINFRGGRPVLASLYALALALFTLLIPALAARISLRDGPLPLPLGEEILRTAAG
jgi:hypothetical protein